jgi:hypothetical protein
MPEAQQLDTKAHNQQLYYKDSQGQYHPYRSTPINLAVQKLAPPSGVQATPATRTAVAQSAKAATTSRVHLITEPGLASDWDGWPDGDWERDYTWEEVRNTKHLTVHWATKTGGGDRKGDEFAKTWERGKRSTRRCLGIITCDNPGCKRIVRPQTTMQGIAKQLSFPCECGAELIHTECAVISVLMTWSEGIHYSNGGHHKHPRPTYILHVSHNEEATFHAAVHNNPTVGPLGLIVGPRGLHGPGKSVTEISPVYINIDRVAKERRKLKKGTTAGSDSFIREFAEFMKEHPQFVVYQHFGIITVISMQTSFMMDQAVRDFVPDEPVNGIVSDAAHGWWNTRTSLLVMSSVYSPILHCWVPILFSYTNGASADHYAIHFHALFDSISARLASHDIADLDRAFAMVS